MDLNLFRSQQDGAVHHASAGFGIAKNLTRIVDANGARDEEAGVGGNQRVEINQHAASEDKADVGGGMERFFVVKDGKD